MGITVTADLVAKLGHEAHILIAGATASGKSALALEIAERSGGVIVNADALQVFSDWRVLTARPSIEEEARADHRLYGHVPGTHPYSVGEWLREVSALMDGGARLIIVGGTGLYFTALTEGLAEIPATPPEIRALADARRLAEGHDVMAAELDAATRARLDLMNPMRVQRAWEVQQSTGRPISAWQDETPAPLLPLDRTHPLLLDAPRDWLNARIARRFDLMLDGGALNEARANLPTWDPAQPSAKAIGAKEIMMHLAGDLSREGLSEAGKIATRQFAKRQRSWFRSKMRAWEAIPPPQV